MWHCGLNDALKTLFVWIIIADVVKAQFSNNNNGRMSAIEYSELKCDFDFSSGNQICDCHNRNEGFILQPISGNIHGLWIRNCKLLSIRQATFHGISSMAWILFENINNLEIEKYALEFPLNRHTKEVKLDFIEVDFDKIGSYALATNGVDSIKFKNCRINKINAFAFMSPQSLFNISFEQSRIDWIESQAFKKIYINHLRFHNTIITNPIAGRAFYDLVITETMLITNCTLSSVTSSAFIFQDVNKVYIAGNIIENVESEAFRTAVGDRISIERNKFARLSSAAFAAIRVGSNYKQQHNSQPMEFNFHLNTIDATDFPIRIAVNQNDFILRIIDLKFTTPIDCYYAEQLEPNSFLRDIGDTVYFRFGNSTDDPYLSLLTIWHNACTLSSTTVAIISTAAVLTLTLIIAITAVFFRFLMKRQRNKRLGLVIPDGKTYRETQIIFQVESAGLLKTDL